MRGLLVASFLAIALLSGCTDTPAEPEEQILIEPEETQHTLTGLVLDASVTPLGGATVSLETGASATSATDGTFRFPDLVAGRYLLAVTLDGYQNQTVFADVGPTEANRVEVTLEANLALPTQQTQAFSGILQCAAEYIIISPSCDSLITFFDPSLGQFESESVYTQGMEEGWQTVVVDVVFDDAAHPGLDGLRMTLRGTQDGDQFLDYQEHGKFFTRDGPTFHIEPGQTYLEGDAPVPADAAALDFEFFGNGHQWHPGGAPVLGVGAGVDVTFEAYITTFYGEPAPSGWSFLA